jgi:hypothetical protein
MAYLEDSSYLHTAMVEEVRDAIGSNTLLTIECQYFETLDDLRSGNIKQMKYWMYKEEALRFASSITNAADPVGDSKV